MGVGDEAGVQTPRFLEFPNMFCIAVTDRPMPIGQTSTGLGHEMGASQLKVRTCPKRTPTQHTARETPGEGFSSTPAPFALLYGSMAQSAKQLCCMVNPAGKFALFCTPSSPVQLLTRARSGEGDSEQLPARDLVENCGRNRASNSGRSERF